MEHFDSLERSDQTLLHLQSLSISTVAGGELTHFQQLLECLRFPPGGNSLYVTPGLQGKQEVVSNVREDRRRE